MDAVLSVIIGSRVCQGPTSLKGISMNQMNKLTAWSSEINLIGEMRSALSHLNKTEKKIAENILADPEAATRKSIAVLAKNSGVSEPSVNRFCKRFNTAGFPDFKLKLAKAAVSGVWEVVHPVQPEDDTSKYTNKIINNTIANLMAFKQKVNHQQIQLAVEALIRAKRIFIVGLGASSATAKDAECKFFQSGLSVCYPDDLIMQRMVVSNYKTGDLFFLISQTGETKEIIEIAELAKLNNAPVIGLAPETSRLARLSTLKLQIGKTDWPDRLSSSSQTSYQVMLDVLEAGISVQKNTMTRILNKDCFKDYCKII
jgi:RpiR family carbohydrate utilization transcriptional regulator